jgi:hypothetical protein
MTGVVSWRFTSLDPDTGKPPDDPLAGFLPPNVTAPEGEGSVSFTVSPKALLPTGTEIRNRATIVFDANPPIDTPDWLNALDRTAPESRVTPLPTTQHSADFLVQWSGNDEGSGILAYSVFVSENGGPYTTWFADTTATSEVFTGVPDRRYDFYSVARDRAGLVEEPPIVGDAVVPDATTAIQSVPTMSTVVTSTSTTSTIAIFTTPCVTASCLAASALSHPACVGETVPTPIRRSLQNTVAVAQQAARAPGKKRRTLQAKAKRALAVAKRKAKRSSRGRRPKLDRACATAIRSAIASAQGALAAGRL